MTCIYLLYIIHSVTYKYGITAIAMTMKPSNDNLILHALFVLGKSQPHEIKQWLDDNANRAIDPTSLSVDYYNTRKGDDIGYEVIGDKPSNIAHVNPNHSPKQVYPKGMDLRTLMRRLK